MNQRFPADTSGADWPYPQTNDRIFPKKSLPMATRHWMVTGNRNLALDIFSGVQFIMKKNELNPVSSIKEGGCIMLMEVDLQKILPNLRALYPIETIEKFCHFISDHGQVEPIQVWFDGEYFSDLGWRETVAGLQDAGNEPDQS